MNGAELLARLLDQYDCVRRRSKDGHAVVSCGRCETIVPLMPYDLPSGELQAIERDLRECIDTRFLMVRSRR